MGNRNDDADTVLVNVSGATRLLSDDDTSNRHRGGKGQTLQEGANIGDYRIIAPIASGGFGAVYKVEHSTTKEQAALKLLHRDKAGSPEIILRFHREAHVMQLLSHPNIVRVMEFNVHEDGRPYFVMELLEGLPLGKYLREKRRLPLEEAVAILLPLCSALAFAHKNDIIHRDLKASNVFLAKTKGGEPRVVLLDFGVAKLCSNDELSLTTSRHAIGTPSSMAPEQIRGKQVDQRTDVYALGNLLFHLLTGKLPFYDNSPAMVQHLHLHTPVPNASSLVPVSPDVDVIIKKAMEKEPDRRYRSVDEFTAALNTLAAGPAVAVQVPEEPKDSEFIAFFAELFVDDELLEDPDESLLDDMESVLPQTEQMLRERGFDPVMTSSNSLLMLRALPIGADGDRQAALDAALAVAERLSKRESRDQRLHVNLCLHATGTGDQEAATRVGNWAPKQRADGLLATSAAAVMLKVEGDPVPGATEFRRLNH